MVAAALTDELIASGASLVGKLDEGHLAPSAAFWFYFSDRQEWSLVIAQDEVESRGPRSLYGQIREVISESKEELPGLSLDMIALIPPTHPLVSLLMLVISTGAGISGIRFTNNVINGTVIEDAYIYRLWRGEQAGQGAP